MNHTCLCLPSQSWYSFTDPGRMEGWVGLGNHSLYRNFKMLSSIVLFKSTQLALVHRDSSLYSARHYLVTIVNTNTK